MAFKLSWKNDNPAGSVIKIYRSTTMMKLDSLPTALATLSNGETSWTDNTVVLNTTYYYLLTVTVNGRTVAGPQKSITIKNRRGIGPSDFINWGDSDDLAYLGGTPYAEQFTYNAFPAGFRALTGFSGDSPINFVKYLHRGRVLYLAATAGGRILGRKVSWDSIYNAGLVYGVDGPGPDGGRGTLAPVDQGGLFDWQGDTYRMRLLTGLSDLGQSPAMTLPDEINNAQHDALPYGRCEYNDLIYPSCEWVPVKQRVPNWVNNPLSSVFNNTATWAGTGFLCQERDPQRNVVVMRGQAPLASEGGRDLLQMIKLVDPSVANGHFVPVIELME